MIGRRGLIALGAGGAATLGAGLLLAPGEAPAPASGVLAYPDLARRLPAARRIELARHSGTVILSRDGDAWRVAERDGWPARPSRVRELLTGLTELRLMEPREADARFGLDDPMRPGATGTRLRVLDANGAALADLILGTRRVRAGLPDTIHLRRADDARGWLAEGRVVAEADPNLWLLRELADIAAPRLRRVEVRRAGENLLVLERPGVVDAPLVIVEPRDPPRPDGVALHQAGHAFEALTLTEVRRTEGLPGEALGETLFRFTDNLAVRLWARKDGADLWVVLRAEGDAEAAALNALWSGYAFQLAAWMERAVIPRLEDLLES